MKPLWFSIRKYDEPKTTVNFLWRFSTTLNLNLVMYETSMIDLNTQGDNYNWMFHVTLKNKI